MAKLKGRGVTIDTVLLRADLQSFKDAALDKAAELAKESLQGMIRAINYNSTYRREEVNPYLKNIRISSGTIDAPLSNAKVIVERKNGKVIARVYHRTKGGKNLFNILDAGSPEKPVTKKIAFPAYIGNLIPVDNPALGDPNRAVGALNPVTIAFDPDTGKPIIIWKRRGDRLAGFEGKRLYAQVANYVEQQLLKQNIVNSSRRSYLRLKAKDIVITVTR